MMTDWDRLKLFLNQCEHDDIAYEISRSFIRIYDKDVMCSITYRFDENGKVVYIE